MSEKRIISICITCFIILLSACSESYTKTENGFVTTIDSVDVEIQFYSPEIVRVVKSKNGFNYNKESLAVIKEVEDVQISVSSTENSISASSDKMKVSLDVHTGAISYVSVNKTPLFKEHTKGTSFTPKEDIGEKTFGVKQSFLLDEDEFIYGLGQYQNGKMSQRNQVIEMDQDNSQIVVPFMLSNKGYGMYWDNYSSTTFSDSSDETSFYSEIGDCIDYYFMLGENADGVIANMRDLTGQAPMMPYWTFGFWQSRERYKSQEEIVGVVKKYRELKVPIDGIIQDWRYWGDNYHWNALEFLNPEFPDPKGMVDEIHDLNANIIISCWPSFGPETKPYKAFKDKNMLLDFLSWPVSGKDVSPPDMNSPSGVRVYDAFNPEARDIYWDHLNDGLFSLGMDGWWLDATEPEHFEPKEEDFDSKTYLGSYRRVHNAFSLEHSKGVATHQKEVSKDKRVFILTRSAFAGQQRYSANSWSGDVWADWGVLRNQISAGLNFSLTGIPYWNTDIGAFVAASFPGGYENKAYHEIYVRWMQFGAFCPMMRSHGTNTPREFWYYGEEGDWTYDALKKMVNLRYSLLPYIYSAAWDVTNNQSSMMRALVMDFPHDKKVLDINNQYMFGKNILVCPVTDPMYIDFEKDGRKHIAGEEDFSAIKTTEVYLPTGTNWIDFWTGEVFKGGQTMASNAPIDILPLFVKAGSIIPFGPKSQYANENIGPLTIRIYPGADASFIFYDDERDNYNYENGAYATFKMKWNDATQTFTIEGQEGTYTGIPNTRKISIVKVDKGKGTGLPFDDEVIKVINYNGDKVEVKL